MATTSMIPKKCAVFLQMPIKLYATVNLIMGVPPEIHMQQRANGIDNGERWWVGSELTNHV